MSYWRSWGSPRMRTVCAAAAAATLILVVGGSRWTHPDHSLRSIAKAAQSAALSGSGSCGCFHPPGVAEPRQGNPLWALFQAQQKGPVIRKWSPYLDVYHRYFQRFRGRQLNFLEVGVQSGGSIGLWQSYFGDGLTYYGLDVNPYCQELFNNPPRVNIMLGDQGDRVFWQRFREQVAVANVTFDIILDDGGHEMHQQINMYEEAWPLLADGGVYICEDTSTSMDTVDPVDYRAADVAPGRSTGPQYKGGYRRPGTWIEYAKQFADTVNGHYVNQTAHPQFDPLERRDSVLSAAFYDQMVVLEKGAHPVAHEIRAGSFLMPIGAKLQDGKVVPEVLAAYRKQLEASLL